MSTSSPNIIPVDPWSTNMDFAALRLAAITFLQEHNPELWTDYNYHDPGVTILEQFCFALTDLAFRTDFDMADLLQKQHGDQSTPFPGSLKLLNSFPVTKNDIRRVILDSLHHISKDKSESISDKIYNAWIAGNENVNGDGSTNNDADANIKNIYSIEIQLNTENYRKISNNDHELNKSGKESLEKEIKHSLGNFRGLCTDFDEVKILHKDEIKITGNVNIKNGYIPEKVLADIYTQIDVLINPNVPFYTLNQLLDKKIPVDKIYEGPALSRGFILDEDLKPRETVIDVSKIRSIIFKTEGVSGISGIRVNGEDNDVYEIGSDAIKSSKHKIEKKDYYPLLKTDLIETEVLQLSKNGAKIELKSLDKLKYHTFLSELNPRIAKPASGVSPKGNFKIDGVFRDVGKYYSLQKYFPAVYGIGDYGLPDKVFVNEAGTDTPKLLTARKAQANQLKAYLLLYEQILGNYLSQLANIDDLFSNKYSPASKTDSPGSQTYFDQAIIDEVYNVKSPNVPNGADVLKKYRDYIDSLTENSEDDDTYLARKEMFLDHLLARVNETVDAYPFVLYDSIYPKKDEHKRESRVLSAKAKYLKEYGTIGYERNKAFNYYAGSLDEENISGLEKKIALLLGIDNIRKRELHKIGKLRIIDAAEAKEKKRNHISEEISEEIIPEISVAEQFTVGNNEIIVDYSIDEEIIIEASAGEQAKNNNKGFHFNNTTSAGINAFFKDGMSLANYKILRHKNKKNKQVYFITFFRMTDEPNSPKWIKIHTHADANAAKSKLKKLAKYVMEVNKDSEGFHLIEHVLLRDNKPGNDIKLKGTAKTGGNNKKGKKNEQYSITVVLPLWPARFQDDGFQAYVQQLFIKHAPIYVELDFIWLDRIYMKEFEEKYFHWLKSLTKDDDSENSGMAAGIRKFLKMHSLKRLKK